MIPIFREIVLDTFIVELSIQFLAEKRLLQKREITASFVEGVMSCLFSANKCNDVILIWYDVFKNNIWHHAKEIVIKIFKGCLSSFSWFETSPNSVSQGWKITELSFFVMPLWVMPGLDLIPILWLCWISALG